MSIQFSVESIEYLADKLCNCRSLSNESLVYLTQQISELISNLLQDACKVVRKCRRKDMIIRDFAFALNLHHIEPMYGYCTASNIHRTLFHKIKKENRILYYIDDRIIPFEELINSQTKIPLDISIRAHWLAVNGKQPTINENNLVEIPIQSTIRSITQNKSNKISHILSTEQQIYYKELTEMCVCSNDEKRKQALLILSSDNSLLQILSRLILFISEGIRVNLTPISTLDRSIILNYLLQMIEALLQNEVIILEPYLHYLLPSILSCLLEKKISSDHWSLRDLAAKCCGQIIRKYNTAVNCLQQRTIDIFYRILIDNKNEYTYSTQYGAFIGLCEMGHKVIIQIVFPLVKQLGEQIQLISDKQSLQKFTEIVVKYITMVYRSNKEKKLLEDFGSYFAPLIQHELILLL